VEGLGLTLSENQLAEAKRRLARLTNPIEIRLADYRELDLEARFDKVASVGMMEHVGKAQLDIYFATVYRLLRPGGLFLNHAIADIAIDRHTIPWTARWRRGFIQTYIFPDSELVPIGTVVRAAEQAGFEVRDLESLREHYAETLACWLSRLEAHFEDAVSMVGSERARAWRLYLASSAVAFRRGKLSVFQLLLAKRLQSGHVANIPHNRSLWYAKQGLADVEHRMQK
jgi:cyclopropane-fatty-acyl-phospholipid synthase